MNARQDWENVTWWCILCRYCSANQCNNGTSPKCECYTSWESSPNVRSKKNSIWQFWSYYWLFWGNYESLECHTKELSLFSRFLFMKRFLIAILVATFLTPVCGSVFASVNHNEDWVDHHHSDMGQNLTSESSLVTVIDMDSVSEHPHIAGPQASCCGWARHLEPLITERPAEKIIKNLLTDHLSSTTDFWFDSFSHTFSNTTDPPDFDRHDYSALVGIIKCLN